MGVPLTYACGDYDLHRSLMDGTIRPDGIDLTVVTYPSPERHWRMLRHLEFDACELSMSSYLMVHDRPPSPFVAIPAFPHRRFRHSYVYVNAAAGISRPDDLAGRRVGVRTWQTTAGLWARGILQDDYGVDLRTIDWVAQDEEDVPFTPPPGFRFRRVTDGQTVVDLLLRGDLDALIYPDIPEPVRTRDPRIAHLFNDPKAVEIEWARRTGFFPIMHTVVIQRSVLEANPWVAQNLLTAFRAAKDNAFGRMRRARGEPGLADRGAPGAARRPGP